jgi:hypothetical protein
MSLIVEDGTGLTNADSMISLAYADTYHSDLGNSDWTGSDADKESAIRRACAYLRDALDWVGFPVGQREQSMPFPRDGLCDRHGYSVASTSVPAEIQRATAELALRELTTPGYLQPDVTPAQAVKREKVGPFETEFDISQNSPKDSRPVMLIVNDLIRDFVRSAGGNRFSAQSMRV